MFKVKVNDETHLSLPLSSGNECKNLLESPVVAADLLRSLCTILVPERGDESWKRERIVNTRAFILLTGLLKIPPTLVLQTRSVSTLLISDGIKTTRRW